MGCALQAQAHYPLVDVFKVEAFLDELAEECKRRMVQTGASNDLEGLKVLNNLMFALPEDGRSAAELLLQHVGTRCLLKLLLSFVAAAGSTVAAACCPLLLFVGSTRLHICHYLPDCHMSLRGVDCMQECVWASKGFPNCCGHPYVFVMHC